MPEHEEVNDDKTKSNPSPLRLLTLTPTTASSPSPFPSFLRKLTNTSPPPDLTTYAGYTSHPPLHLTTKYYTSDVGIWCDELPAPSPSPSTNTPSPSTPDPPPTLSEWQSQMLSDPAREVRDVIGGIVLLLPLSPKQTSNPKPTIEQWIPYISATTLLRDGIEDDTGRDVAGIILLIHSHSPPSQTLSPATDTDAATTLEHLEDTALSTHGLLGWDFVLWTPTPSADEPPATRTQRNDHGELTGFPRVLEVLEAVDWTVGPSMTSPASPTLDFDDDDDDDGLITDQSERDFTREMLELKLDLHQENEEGEDRDQDGDRLIERLPGLVERVVGVREAAAEMTGVEKQRFARREVERIMRELG